MEGLQGGVDGMARHDGRDDLVGVVLDRAYRFAAACWRGGRGGERLGWEWSGGRACERENAAQHVFDVQVLVLQPGS